MQMYLADRRQPLTPPADRGHPLTSRADSGHPLTSRADRGHPLTHRADGGERTGGASQEVDADADSGRDEHHSGVDVVVLVVDAHRRHVDEDRGHDPDKEDRDERTHHLCNTDTVTCVTQTPSSL